MARDAAREKVSEEESYEPQEETSGERESALRRFWGRVAHAWRWLRRPDEVGRTIALRPRSVRLLVLLVLGNLLVLALMAVALYQAMTMPVAVESPPTGPPPPPVVITASPGPAAGEPSPSPCAKTAMPISMRSIRPTGDWCV
jgi:hypothetical protein